MLPCNVIVMGRWREVISCITCKHMWIDSSQYDGGIILLEKHFQNNKKLIFEMGYIKPNTYTHAHAVTDKTIHHD